MANDTCNKKPRGWLLFYIIWTSLTIVAGLAYIGIGLWSVPPGLQPQVKTIFWLSGVILFAWYVLYGWCLKNLAQLRPHAVEAIKLMIIGTPVINTILPFLRCLLLGMVVDDVPFGKLIKETYTLDTFISLGGAYAIAIAWLVYFHYSKQVKELWADGLSGDLKKGDEQ